MATKTTFLQLVLPANNEFFNTWDQVVNENFVKVEDKINSHDSEIIASRFSLSSMDVFLAVSHNPDGTLKATGETVSARNSRIYGHKDSEGVYSLEKRVRLNDFENFYARRGQADIKDSLAIKKESMILDGAKSGLGQPTWLGYTAAKARIDGSGTQIDMLIDGQYSRIRALEEVTISGAAATYFLYAEYSSSGAIVVDGDSTTSPPASATGVTGSDINSDVRIFSDPAVDFTTYDVKAGDVLRILGNTAVSGDYIIEEVAAESNNNYLRIIGIFASSLGSLDYVIIDSYKPTLGFAAAETPVAGRMYIGEADFDGIAVTAVRPRQFKRTFVGDWRAVDVSGGSPTFEEIWSHYLGTADIDVVIQVSQANDGSLPVEQLSLSEHSDPVLDVNNGTLGITNTLSLTPGDQTLGGGVAISGSVSGAFSTPGKQTRSARMKHTRNLIYVKNIFSALFYTDYDGTVKQTGYIRVIVQKKEG